MPLTRNIDARDYKNTITNALFMHTSAAMYLRHRDNSTYLDNAVKVSRRPTGTPSETQDLTEVYRLGNGVRLFYSPLETLLLTHCSVAGTGLRDSDDLWFDGMHGCMPTDKVRTRAFPPLLGTAVYV